MRLELAEMFSTEMPYFHCGTSCQRKNQFRNLKQ